MRLWLRTADTGQWECKSILDDGHTKTVRSVSWSPGGLSLASASFDGTTSIWRHTGQDWEQVLPSIHGMPWCMAVWLRLPAHSSCCAWNVQACLLIRIGADAMALILNQVLAFMMRCKPYLSADMLM